MEREVISALENSVGRAPAAERRDGRALDVALRLWHYQPMSFTAERAE